eukprot:Sspe_Gene.88217::Locus_60274_Transcript_1_1_Confidence_1.000_Length_988::g.88217::m.88217/K14860/TMA16; translation machinery-associated protein 16
MGGRGKKGKALTKLPTSGGNKAVTKKEGVRKPKVSSKAASMKKGNKLDMSTDTKLVHPNSRKAKQLLRGITQKSKKAALKQSRDLREKLKVKRYLWFKERMEMADMAERTHLTPEEVKQVVAEYLKRNDEELVSLAEKRKSKTIRVVQASGRERDLEMLREAEIADAAAEGIEAPQLHSKAGIRALREWDGTFEKKHTLVLDRLKPPSEIAPVFTIGEAAKKEEKQKANPMKVHSKGLEDRKEKQAAIIQKKRAALLTSRRKGVEPAEDVIMEDVPRAAAAAKAAQQEKKAKQVASAKGFAFGAPKAL